MKYKISKPRLNDSTARGWEPAEARGRHCHSRLSMAAIDRYFLGICIQECCCHCCPCWQQDSVAPGLGWEHRVVEPQWHDDEVAGLCRDVDEAQLLALGQEKG